MLTLVPETIHYPSGPTDLYFGNSAQEFLSSLKNRRFICITDDHVANLYPALFDGIDYLTITPGETSKTLDTVQRLCEGLLKLDATRKTLIIGIGGGVVSDIIGLLASVFMRGVSFGFIPTTLLGMVDAAIGGKNGVNLGDYKNMIGVFAQPEFIIFDTHFLNTLPSEEWHNGFAEIIKYGCIFDEALFAQLDAYDVAYYKNNTYATCELIKKCVAWKNKTVIEDEKETGIRKLLNFGHTTGHAIETLYQLPHGYAVSVGMVVAARLSEQLMGFPASGTLRLETLLAKYHLPTSFSFNVTKTMEILKSDKKRNGDKIDLVLLNSIGQACVHATNLKTVEATLSECAQ